MFELVIWANEVTLVREVVQKIWKLFRTFSIRRPLGGRRRFNGTFSIHFLSYFSFVLESCVYMRGCWYIYHKWTGVRSEETLWARCHQRVFLRSPVIFRLSRVRALQTYSSKHFESEEHSKLQKTEGKAIKPPFLGGPSLLADFYIRWGRG